MTEWSPPAKVGRAEVVRSSCASVSLRWGEPESHGWSIEEYRVWAAREGRREGEGDVEEQGLRAAHVELTGLLPGTMYEFRVQASRGYHSMPAHNAESGPSVYGAQSDVHES
ncbi:MAG: hypothetical protein SGPRY_002822 [Prymnesium sp.]